MLHSHGARTCFWCRHRLCHRGRLAVAGLRGTGSKAIHLVGEFVPEHRVESFDELSSGTARGIRGLFDTNPVPRVFHDMHAITQHAAVDLDFAAERYGKWLLAKRDTTERPNRRQQIGARTWFPAS
jgi:hypothetical protein